MSRGAQKVAGLHRMPTQPQRPHERLNPHLEETKSHTPSLEDVAATLGGNCSHSYTVLSAQHFWEAAPDTRYCAGRFLS